MKKYITAGKLTGKQTQHGMSLLEVLVAMLVMGIGMAMCITMLLASNRYGDTAGSRAVAMTEMQSIIDAMQANPLGARGYLESNAGTTLTSNLCSSGCDAATRMKADAQTTALARAHTEIQAWKARIAARLPAGEGQVTAIPNSQYYNVHVQWRQADENQQSTNSSNPNAIGELNLVFGM